jgi:hypothetical protein
MGLETTFRNRYLCFVVPIRKQKRPNYLPDLDEIWYGKYALNFF